MLLLFELEELNSVYIEYIVHKSEEIKIYVASKELYLYFRYTLKINVDMVSLKDNHIYTCEGIINDNIPVYSQSVNKHLNRYGTNCEVTLFIKNHCFSDELGG